MPVFKFGWIPFRPFLFELASCAAEWTELILRIVIAAVKLRHMRPIIIKRSLIHPLHRTFLNTQQLSVFLQRIFQPAHKRFMPFLSIVV
jgi:hypothetical protein